MANWWDAAPLVEQQAHKNWWDAAPLVSDTGTPADDLLSEVKTASGGILEGLPIVGPVIRGGTERAAAATLALYSGQPYGKILEGIQQQSSEEKAANPWLDKGAQITGAVVGTVPMVAAAPAAFGAGGGHLAARTLASAGTGTLLGGTDAAVRSGGDAEAIKNGALWGLGAGAVAPGVGQAVGALVSKLRPGVDAASQAFQRAIGSDAVDDVAGRLASLGPDAMPMDLGPNLQRQAGALAATPGRGQEVVRTAVAERQARAGSRVAQSLDDALGKPLDTAALAEGIIKKRSAAAKPLYTSAYSKPIPYTKDLEELLKRPSVSKAAAKAKTLAADEGIPSQQWFANIADDGKVTIQNVPDIRQLDLTKRALDDMIDAASRAGNKNEARILGQQKDLLLGMMDEAVPEYAQARAAYAGPSSVIDALEAGQGAFASNLTPNQLRTELLKMDKGAREAFVQGARAKVSQIMGTARNDALAARSTFDKGWNKEKLAIIVGKDKADELLRSLDAETAFTRTRDVVTGNSETAARVAAQGEIAPAGSSPGIFRNAMNMRFGDAAANLADKALGGMQAASRSASNEQLAQLLSSRDPKVITQAIKAVQAAQRRGDITMQRSKELLSSLMIGGSQDRPRVPAPSAGR